MSAYGMHPTFNDSKSYREWRATWRRTYKELSQRITKSKHAVKDRQRLAPTAEKTADAQRELIYERAMGNKMMSMLNDAKERWKRILAMKEQMDAQQASFPLDLGKCAVIDVHYNKAHTQFPTIVPVWVLKAKGKSYYLHHIDFSNVSFSTRELAEGSTKGMLRFRHCYLKIDSTGAAVLFQQEDSAMQVRIAELESLRETA